MQKMLLLYVYHDQCQLLHHFQLPVSLTSSVPILTVPVLIVLMSVCHKTILAQKILKSVWRSTSSFSDPVLTKQIEYMIINDWHCCSNLFSFFLKFLYVLGCSFECWVGHLGETAKFKASNDNRCGTINKGHMPRAKA